MATVTGNAVTDFRQLANGVKNERSDGKTDITQRELDMLTRNLREMSQGDRNAALSDLRRNDGALYGLLTNRG